MELALDIETLPTDAAMSQPYPEEERHPPANYKNADTIAEWRVKDRAAWQQERIKTYSLSPLWGRICAVGFAEPGRDWWITAKTEDGEKVLLHFAWAEIQRSERILTWNGHGFDLPFLMLRSALLDVPVPVGAWLKRYAHHPHCDVKMLATNWSTSTKGGLDDYAQAFGFGKKIAHGSQVYAMAQEGRWEEIGRYAADDAKKTLQLYQRLAPVFLG